MSVWFDNVKFNPTAGGTTDWTVSTGVSGYQTPALAGAVNGKPVTYFAFDTVTGQWEIGTGNYNTTGPVVPRTTVYYNSSGTGSLGGNSGAGTKINFTNVPQVALVALKVDLISVDEANTFTTAQKDQARSNISAAPATTPITNSLGGDVLLNNTANYFDGPSVAQGSTGTWFASGTVTITNTAAATNINAKLWDGTTVIASTNERIELANGVNTISLSGFLASPAGNLRISCRDIGSTTGKMLFNNTGNSKDCTITAFRIA